jgi:hypothetical protein
MYILQGKIWSIRHIRFLCQSTYTTHTLPTGSPRMWQPFTPTQQSWTDSLLPRKSAPDSTSQPVWAVCGTHLSFSLHTAIEAMRLTQISVDEQATRLTGPISPACNQYVQYLLTGVNPSVLNRHRWGYNLTGVGLPTSLPDLPNRWSHTFHLMARPVSGHQLLTQASSNFKSKALAVEWPPCHSISTDPYNYV